eukprot:g9930.t1
MSAAALTNNAGSSSGSFPPPIKKQAPPSFKSTSGLLDAAGDGGTAGNSTAAFGGALPLPLPLAASGQHGTAGAAATGGTNTSPSWQHPYVCVFKKFAQLLTKQGDCVEDLDNVISKRVFKIQGAISANNYVQVPKQGAKAPAKSLGLTGEFIYVQLRTLGGKFFNVHLDFAVADRNILERITLTNMQSEPKAQSRVILYPCHLPNDEWATVCLRVPQVLKLFSRSMPHAHVLKAVQVCASCVVRNVYTSDLRFQSHAELPREMKLTQKESSGELVSNWLNIPESVDAELKVSEPAPPPPAAAAAGGNGQVRQDPIVAPNDQSVTGVGAIQPAKILADPLIEVNRLLGVSSGAKNLAFWLGEDRIVFASSTALVVMAASSDPDDKPPPLFLFGHSRPIGLLQTSAAGDWVASVQQAGGGDGPSIRLWYAPAQTGPTIDVIHRAHASRIVDGAVSVLYEELVTVTEDGFIKIWSINTMRQHTEFFSGNDAPCCVGCHPKRHLIAVGFRSGTLRLFDVDGPQVIGEFVNFKFPVVSLAFAQTEEQDKSLIVACDSKGAMVLYEEANNFAPSRNPDLFAGLQEPPPQNCPLFVLADSHRLLLKYYDARTLALFTFQDLEFQRKFNLRAASVSHYSFSFDSTKVLVGCSDAKLKIFSVKGPLLHDIPLVAGPVTAAALVTLESPKPDPFQTPDCLLFTASEQDSLIKASLLRSGTKAFTAHREEEQCFLGHAFAPYKLLVTPNKLIGVSGSEVITWDVKGSYFEEVYYNSHVRQDALPAEEAHAGEGAEQTLLNGTENGSREPDFLINTNGQNVTNLDQIAENSFTRGLGGRGSSSSSGSARKNGRDTDKQGFTPTPGLFVADQKSKSPSQGATARATPPAFMFYPNTSPGDSLGSSTMFIESGNPQSYSSISPIKKKVARGGNKTGEPTTAADHVNASVATILKQSTEQESLLAAKKTSFSAQKVKAPPNSTVKAHGRLAELQEMQHRKDLQDAVEQAGKALQFDDGFFAEDPKTKSKNFVQGGSSSSASASVKLAGGAAGDAVSQLSRMSDVDDLSATCVLQKSGLGLEVQFDGGPEDAAAAEVAGEQCTVIDEQTGVVKNAAKKKSFGPAVSTVIGSGTPFSWEPRYLVTGVGDWISVEPNAGEHGVNFVEKSVIPLNNRQVHAIDTQDNMLAVLCDGLVLVYELWIPPAQGGQNGGGNVSISKAGSNGTGGKTKAGSAGKNKVASSKFEFGPDARGEAGTSNPGSPSTDESAADEEANTHKLIASYSLGNAGLQGAIVKFLNAETLIVITRREHPDTVNADESKVSIIDDSGSDIKASIAAASPKDAVDGPLPPQPAAHSQTKTSVSVESRIDALRLPRGSKSAVAVPVRLQHSWEEIEGAIASSAPLEFVTSALVSSSPTGCAIAPLDEFITMAPQSLMFWRLCPDNAVLQFQQAHKPAWITSPGHTFSALSFAYVKPELSRVLVGTSRGVLLTYDFEENLPINEMPLPQGNAGAINFIDAPAYPLVLCGVGATVGKYVVDEAGHKVMPVPRGYVESDVKSMQQNKALVEKPVHLDGVVHKCATQDRSGRSMMATSTSLWYVNWRTNVKLRLHSFHAFPSNTMECHPEKNLLATCADDGLVRLWSYKERPSRSLTGLAQFSGASPCLSLTFLSSRILFCGFQDGCVRLLDLENLTSIGRVEVEQTGLVLVEALGPQTAVAATKEGKVVQIMAAGAACWLLSRSWRWSLSPQNGGAASNVKSAATLVALPAVAARHGSGALWTVPIALEKSVGGLRVVKLIGHGPSAPHFGAHLERGGAACRPEASELAPSLLVIWLNRSEL